MADPRFFQRAGPFLLHELARCGEAELANPADKDRRIADVQAIETAGPDDIAYAESKRMAAALAGCRAGAVLLGPELAAAAPQGCAILVSATPALAFARIALLFYPEPPAAPGIHPTATVAANARLGEGVSVAGGAV